MESKIGNSSISPSDLLESNDLFTKKLIIILQQNAFQRIIFVKGSNQLLYRCQKVMPLLPLKSVILDYLKPFEIANSLSFEQIGTEIRVLFNPPQSILTNKIKQAIKTYDYRKGEIIIHHTVPLLEIWPNFVCPKWKIYFSHFSNTDDRNTFYARPILKNLDKIEKSQFTNAQGEIKREIIKSNHFPDAYECKTYWINSRRCKVQIDAGILLLDKPETRNHLKKKFNIGVHLGATCTNIYICENNNLPVPMIFSNNVFKITIKLDKQEHNNLENPYLFPHHNVNMPFLNLFHNFQLKNATIRPVLDGQIYFPGSHKESFYSENIVRIAYNNDNPYELDITKAFLEQLCIMCAAEVACKGAEEITWSFSYSNSLSNSTYKILKKINSLVIQANSSTTGIESIESSELYKNEIIESVKYFSYNPDIRATIPEGVVFLIIDNDVSRISIWQKLTNQLLVQTSLPFANWDFFFYPLWKRIDFLGHFCSDEEIRLLTSRIFEENKTAFYTQLEALVNANCMNMLKRLPSLYCDQMVKGFKQLIAIAFSGLFYYIGLILRYLTDKGIYEKRIPKFYVGGGGSRALHWLANGNYNSNSAINKVFKSVFSYAYTNSLQNDLKIILSLHPGAETAYSLSSYNSIQVLDKERMDNSFLFSGETFENLKGEQFKWDTLISKKQIKSGIKISSKLEHINAFIESFNKEALLIGIPTMRDNLNWSTQIQEKVNHTLSISALKDENKIQIEPLFLLTLKELFLLRVKEWARES